MTAEDGQRGVEVASEYGNQIHLILADIAMPRLSGPDAVQQIRRQRPQLKVLLLTGFADSKLLEGKSLEEVSILEKPIAPEVLASQNTGNTGTGITFRAKRFDRQRAISYVLGSSFPRA